MLGALEAGPATLAGLVAGDRAGPPDRAPARGRARAPPAGGARHAGPVHPRPAAGRAGRRRRRGPAARRGGTGARRTCATSTGESAQLYRRQGDQRICVAAAERLSGLRDTRPGRLACCRCRPARPPRCCWPGRSPSGCTAACRARASPRPRSPGVRRRGWAQSVGEREPGVASVSAPVRGAGNRVVAAVSVSGPIERLSRAPGRMHAQAVIDAAARLTEALRRSGGA